MKSETGASYYVPDGSSDDGRERFVSTRATAGPWTERAQHGGPPAALLGRAIEAITEPGRVVGRFAMDLLGPIPVGPLALAARGRTPWPDGGAGRGHHGRPGVRPDGCPRAGVDVPGVRRRGRCRT